MPKIRRVTSKSYERSGSKSPHTCTTKNSNKKWDDILCPICMEPPHNAVLLICSSNEKGCRPYMCNFPGQSDCLGKYRATSTGKLSCPFCRGHISEERIVEGARRVMDSKVRSCRYIDSCGFSGTRAELTWHSHHSVASEEEQRRRREWARLQREWELRDIYNAILAGPLPEVDESHTRLSFGGQFQASGETRIIVRDVSTDGTATSTNVVPHVTSATGAGSRPQPQIRRNQNISHLIEEYMNVIGRNQEA